MKQIPFKKAYCEPKKRALYTNLFNNFVITNGEEVIKLSLFTPKSVSAEKLSKNYVNAETLEDNAENNRLRQYSTQCTQLLEVENLGKSFKEIPVPNSFKVHYELGLANNYCLLEKNFKVTDFMNEEKDKVNVLVKESLAELILKSGADKIIISQIGKYSLHVKVYRGDEAIMSFAPAINRSNYAVKNKIIREITK